MFYVRNLGLFPDDD
jgi:hypothetical protein